MTNKNIKIKIKKAKNSILKIPIAIITLIFSAFFLVFLAIFIRKKVKRKK